jgi:uncharacterized membrane protein YphA (DoxX/SURF4 family)
MTDLQAYLIALSGFIIVIIVILIASEKACSWLIRFGMTLFILQTASYGIRLLSLPFPRNITLAHILYASYIISYSFYAGCFIGHFVTTVFFKRKFSAFKALLLQNKPILYKLLRYSVASVFLWSSIASLYQYNKALHFFTISGYSSTFFIFIIIAELLGGIGLLFRKTTLYVALLLECDMIGAIYTHYHNYFTKQLPDPLGNSIPSLITQTVLITIIIFTLHNNKKHLDVK